MLSAALKRSFATIPNRRVFPTTTTSPTPSTHNDKHLDAKPIAQPAPTVDPNIDSAPSTSHIIPEQTPTTHPIQPEVSNWSIPVNVQGSFPKPGAKRPHLNIQVNPNHGLWHFFRALRFEESTTKDGRTIRRRADDKAESDKAVWRRVAHEDRDALRSISGRSWTASELRRKSFYDLHILWYLVLRERNLLATQEKENDRSLLPPRISDLMRDRSTKCRKTQARIKLVLSERRRGYERAIESLPKGLGQWRKERWGSAPGSLPAIQATIPESSAPSSHAQTQTQ